MREIIAGIFIICGIIIFCISIFGIYRLKYVMNRMHAAALGDTLGLALIIIGLMIVGIDIFHGAKYLLIILFFWMTSPIATNMIARIEVLTNKDYEERVLERDN